MGRYYIASLCKNGLLGGGISVDEDGITFHTGKVTVPKEYRHLQMKYDDICGVTTGKLFVLPTVTIALRDGREYRFFVVGRNRLANTINEKIKK